MFQEFPDDKNDDFLNEFRQKIAEQSAANFEEKRMEMRRSKSVFIGAVSGVALAAVVGWFVLSPRYAVDNPEEIPVIRRPQTAIKVQPSEPGGMEILNQDKSVYDIVEKKTADERKVENLLPPPEEPKLPVIAAQPSSIPDDMFETPSAPAVEEADKIIAKAQKVTPAQEVPEEKVVSIKEAAQATSDNVVIPAKVETVKVVKGEKVKVENKDWSINAKTEAKAQVQQAQNVAAPAPVATPAPEKSTVASAPKGTWQVQLMSSQNKKATENAWNTLVKKYPPLKGQPHEIETADLDFDGVFYRLKAGAFSDRAGADSLCRDIKALGGTCIVKKK